MPKVSHSSRPATLEPLENRLLYARTPADVRPDSLGKAFDAGERKALLGRLGNMSASTYGVLSRHLKAGRISAFDDRLLAYMRDRPGTHYFFDESEAGSIATYTKNNLNIGTQIEHADNVTDDRLFPEQSSSTRYTVQLPSRINWKDAARDSNPEFIYALNRQEWWVDLAQSYRYTGDAKYMNELQYELASWSQQNESFELPDNTGRYTSYGFDTAIRVDDWIMSYFSVLGSSGWTGAANSLMLYKLVQQGDVLNTVATNTTDFTSNRSTIIGKTATMLGFALPEADAAPRWRKNGRDLLFGAMDAQLYADGSHREQSPGYALNVLDNVLEARQMDKIHGVDWPTHYLTTAVNAVDALWQQLSPNGKRPGIGDTFRLSGNGQFTKAALALDITRWPEGKANPRDAWTFGTTAVAPYKHDTENDLADRGPNAAFPDSGNYVMRSGNGDTARQINFTAGPKGGVHGHYNYMGFELSGYGRPLIADPGAYIYDDSAAREWVVSAAAHNTVSVTGVNPADLQNNNDILVSGLQSVAGGTMISASYNGYQFLDGNPTLSRSLWYDGNNTIVIVDFASASDPTSFETGFTLEGQDTGRDLTGGTIYTRNGSGGNVRIQSLLGGRQSASIRTKGVFTSPTPSDLKDPATHYYAAQSKTNFAVFATVITAYNGSAASAVNNVTWQRMPTRAGQTAILNVNGQSITFAGPQFAQVGRGGQTRGTYNDVAYDEKGRLHMAFYDRDTRTLKYALRATNGVWGSIQTIDGQQDVGLTPSLVIDSENRPHVAYQDAGNGDLRYAYVSDETEAWVVQTVDVKGSTGAYPSLQLSRKGGAMIAYYNKTNGDLRLATSDTGGFKITTIDSRGDVGRFPSLQLDPNRPTASKAAIAYEDTTGGTFKYAIQAGEGYKFETIDGTTKEAGGYVSMRFYDAGETFEPVATYYDAANGHLKYAARTAGTWRNTTIASGRRQGLYSQLAIVKNTPRVFFYDGRNNDALYLSGTKIWGGRWSQTKIAEGGREIHYAVDGRGRFAFTGLDEGTGFLTVGSV